MFRELVDLYVWYKGYLKYNSFLLKNAQELNVSFGNSSYIIVLEPWKYTAVSWFAITLGILLFRRNAQIKFLVNDLPFEKGIRQKSQILAIKSALKKVSAFFVYDLLSNYKKNVVYNYEKTVDEELYQFAFANAVHRNKGEQVNKEFKEEVNAYFKCYISHYSTIENYVKQQKVDCFILPGGIYGYSGVFSSILKRNGNNYFTYDSAIGFLLTSFNGVAAQVNNIPDTLHLILKEQNNDEIEYAKKIAYEESEQRINGTNSFKTQYSSINESKHIDNVGFLMPLNSPWDSAMLKIDYLFDSYREWVIETVGYILKNTAENVTIRQHPDERHFLTRSNLDFGKILKNTYQGNHRIQYISCTDKINTYSLLPNAKAVICFSSTFGIEAALAGKKVISCSNAYYTNLNFIIKPTDKVDLVDIIKKIDNIPSPSESERNIAALTFYLGQRCNWINTKFTPSNVDFSFWSELALCEIENYQEISMILKSIEEKVPVSYLIHKKLYANRTTL